MRYKITIIAISSLVVFSSRIGAALPDTTQEKESVPTKESEENLSDVWLNTVWKSIDEVTTTKESYEVEKITTVAGVRGDEAEDEATKHLYYKGSMSSPGREDLLNAIERLEAMIGADPGGKRVPEFKHYVIQCYIQLGRQEKAAELQESLLRDYPDSKWTASYK